MKVLLFAAASALALMLAAPANAASGYVGAAYSRAEVDTGLGDGEADVYGVEGAVAFHGDGVIGLDLDAAYASDSDDSNIDSSGVNAHIYARAAGYKIGGFAGMADVADETVWSAGVEGQHSFGRFTLAGALGYAEADDVDIDARGADVEARFFASDNVRIDGNLGWANYEVGGVGEDDVFSFGLGAEFQLPSTPLSFRAGYVHAEFDEIDVDADAFTVGVRLNWSPNLKDRDANGPSFAGLSRVGSLVSFF